MAAVLGWPVLADPRSGLRQPVAGVIGTADGILRSEPFAARHRPEVIVRLGERWVSKVVNGFLSRSIGEGATCMVVDPFDRWPDPEREVAEFIRADPGLFAARWPGRAEDRGPPGRWLPARGGGPPSGRRLRIWPVGSSPTGWADRCRRPH